MQKYDESEMLYLEKLMTDIETIDQQFGNKLQEAFEHKEEHGEFPKEHDIWVNQKLETAFYPLCMELATNVRTMTDQEIAAAKKDLRDQPSTLPLIRIPESEDIPDFGYEGVAAFIAYHRHGDSKDQILARAEEHRKKGIDISVGSLFDTKISVPTVEKPPHYLIEMHHKLYKGIDELSREYDEIADIVLPHLTEDLSDSDRRKLCANALVSASASKLMTDFPLSERADQIIAVLPLEMENSLGEHFFWYGFAAPGWFDDPTIAQDMLATLNIISTQTLKLEDQAKKIGIGQADFLQSETTRGREYYGTKNILLTMNEGLLSITQAVNMTAGQLKAEYGLSDEEAVIFAMKNGAANLMARYLPAGYLGPIHLDGRHIESFFEMDDDGLRIGSENLNKCKEIKRKKAEDRSQNILMSSLDLYHHREFRPTLSLSSGLVCPLTRKGNDKISGVELLNYAYMHVYTSLRKTRAEGG